MRNRKNFTDDFEVNRKNYKNALAYSGFANMMSDNVFQDLENVYYGCRDMDANEIIQVEAEMNDNFFRQMKTNKVY